MNPDLLSKILSLIPFDDILNPQFFNDVKSVVGHHLAYLDRSISDEIIRAARPRQRISLIKFLAEGEKRRGREAAQSAEAMERLGVLSLKWAKILGIAVVTALV